MIGKAFDLRTKAVISGYGSCLWKDGCRPGIESLHGQNSSLRPWHIRSSIEAPSPLTVAFGRRKSLSKVSWCPITTICDHKPEGGEPPAGYYSTVGNVD